MADPFVFANAQVLNDGVSARARWKETKGLWTATMRLPARQDNSMSRKIQQHPGTLGYAPRKLNWAGRLINQGSFWAGRQQLSLMASRMATRPTRLQIGSLFLDADFNDLVPKEDDKYNLLPNEVTFDTAGDAPGLWKGAYQYALGLAQGITVSDDRIDQPGYLVSVAAGAGALAFFTFNNPGDAPCEAVLTFSLRDYPSTTIHIQNQSQDAPRAIVYTTDANGNGRLDERHGLILMPGTNLIYIQNSTGALLSVATSGFQGSFCETVFRWTGNEGNRFQDSPMVWVPYRQGAANYINSVGTFVASGDCQARIGVTNAPYSAANAGLILEMGSANILSASVANCSNYTAWYYGGDGWANPGASGANNVTTYLGGVIGNHSVEVYTTNTSINEGIFTPNLAGSMTINSTYTFGVWLNGPSGNNFIVAGNDYSNSVSLSLVGVFTGNWQFVSVTLTTGSSALTTVRFAVLTEGYIAMTWVLGAAQVEAGPIPTSWLPGATSRNADIAALWVPQNYNPWSRAFEKWTPSGGGSVAIDTSIEASDGLYWLRSWTTAGANTLTSSLIMPDVPPSSIAWTVGISMWQGTIATGDFTVKLLDQSLNVLGSVAVPASSLLTTNKTTYILPVAQSSIAASVSGFYIQIVAPSAGTLLVESCGLTQGNMTAGSNVLTQGSPIVQPADGWVFPSGQWVQNGSMTVTAVLPPISTGLSYYVFGSSSDSPCLFRYTGATTGQTSLVVRRNSDGGTVQLGDGVDSTNVGNVWDGNPHVFRVWWVNYTVNGSKMMILGLDVDGVTKGTVSVASSTVTSWDNPERLWLSNGNTNATLQGVILGFPADKIPAGATLPAA